MMWEKRDLGEHLTAGPCMFLWGKEPREERKKSPIKHQAVHR